MSYATLTRAVHLQERASHLLIRQKLSALVRRLVHATVDKPTLTQFPSDEGIDRRGWDGVVECAVGNAWMPTGKSVWELGTDSKPKEKAEKEYRKRTTEPGRTNPPDTTFVFVTPRKWERKTHWCDAKRAEGIWKDVRVLDSADLEEWLEHAPAVDLWLARLLGIMPPAGLRDPLGRWNDLATISVPPLTPEVFLCNRQEIAAALREVLAGPPQEFAVATTSPQELVDFACAVLEASDEETQDAAAARALIVNNAEAWSQLVAMRGCRLFLIPGDQLETDERMVCGAVNAGHSVLTAKPYTYLRAGTTTTRLPCVPAHELQQVLEAAGFASARAARYAQLTELSPEDRARLLGENFDLPQALANKQARRQLLAKLSVPEKMHILQEMMKSSQLRRGSRRSATVETLPPRFFGGRATATGTNYEARIAALFGTKMLAGGGAILWEDVPVANLSTITMQAAEPVDDIVLARKGTTAKIFFSAKSRRQRVPLTKKSPAFAEVIDAFVRQFLKLNPADRQACWLAWAVPPTAGEPATRDLRRALDTWRMCDVECPLQDFLDGRTKRERTAIERLLMVAEESWQKVVGNPPDELSMKALLRRVRVEVFDFDSSGGDADRAKGILADSVLLDPGQATDAWDWLVGFFNDKNEYGTPVTLTLLRKTLTKARIALKPLAGFAEEIARLQELTSRNFALLAAHDTIQPGADLDKTVHVNRVPELNALRAAVGSSDLLITGEPGSGKSGLMHSLAHACMENAVPVVLLLAEQISGRDWKGAANLPGFDRHPLDEILANWPSDVPGVLLTDALDAVRDPDAQRMLRGLLDDVKRGRSGWKVVASVRAFDLEHGQELRGMFPGVGVSGFASARFDGIKHFHVPRLSDEQLGELIRQHKSFRPFIEHASRSPKSENLHRSPFYLRLAAELMRAGISPERMADWASPAVLLQKYWEERVLKEPHSAENKQVLRAICEKMVQARSMVISEQDVPLQAADFKGIKELRGRGVLQSSVHSGGVLVGDDALGFTHHLLHDYAIATALIPKHPPQRLVAFVTGEPLLPVFYRQSFVFALEALWDVEGNGRRLQFWNTALQLEAAPALHGITRIVAPVLAARRVETFGDLEPLVNTLAAEPGNDAPPHRALRHLISGLQDAHPDAIRAGAEGWLRFAVELTRLLPTNAAVEWPLTLLLDHLNSMDERQPLPARGLLNDAGRNLLGSCLTPASSIRQRYTMNVAIAAVCQSFNAAPAESRSSLLALLTPDRLARFPHRDLSQLAHKLKYLGGEGNEIVRQLFEAVFTREQQSDELEERGSVLMSMQFRASDLWNSIRHTLADYYKTLGDEDADLVTELACVALNRVSHRSVDHTTNESAVLSTISFRGVRCDLVEDFASFRGHDHEPDKGAIASRFEEHLRVWAAANDQSRLDAALDRFARCNHNSSTWSTLLEIGAEYPNSLGARLETVLAEPVFQIHEDYRYAGVELFRALHQSGDQQRRQRLEQLILNLSERYRPWRDADDALVKRWVTAARKRLLGVLRDANIVLEVIKTMKADLETVEALPTNERPAGFESYSHTYTDEELMEERGIKLSDESNKEMFRLRGELKHFLRHNNQPTNPLEIERLWPVIDQCEQILARASDTHSQMARELWGYTRRQIHDALGGSLQSYLPHKDGRVVAACLTKKLNPQAPEIVLVGKGSIIEAAGEFLAQQTGAIPVFLKQRSNEWVYEGEYRVAASHTSPTQRAQFVAGANRDGVVRVILLEKILDSQENLSKTLIS